MTGTCAIPGTEIAVMEETVMSAILVTTGTVIPVTTGTVIPGISETSVTLGTATGTVTRETPVTQETAPGETRPGQGHLLAGLPSPLPAAETPRRMIHQTDLVAPPHL